MSEIVGQQDPTQATDITDAANVTDLDTAPDNQNRSAAQALSALGGAASAIEQVGAGRANKELAEQNRQYALAQEAQDRQAGEFAAVRRGIVADQLAGRTRAMQSGSGTVVGAGTNRLVVNDQKLGSAMDQYMDRLNAGRQAQGAQIRAASDQLTGDLSQRAGETGATSTILNTAGNEWLESDPRYDPRFSRGLQVSGSGGY